MENGNETRNVREWCMHGTRRTADDYALGMELGNETGAHLGG